MVHHQGAPSALPLVLRPRLICSLTQGDVLDRTGTEVRFPCHRNLPVNYRPEDLVFQEEILESKEELPPEFPWQGKGVMTKCVVTTDLSELAQEESGLLVRRKAADGSEYHSLHYELVMNCGSTSITFSAQCQGKSLGEAKVEWY